MRPANVASWERQVWTLISKEETREQRREQYKSEQSKGNQFDACRDIDLAKVDTMVRDQILGLELCKWYRTLKAMLTDLVIKENILQNVLLYKYWLLLILKI